MKKVFLLISGVLVGIILFQFLFYKCETGKQDRIESDLRKQLDACVHAPEVIRVDTVRDTIKTTISIPVTKYVVVDKVPSSDFDFNVNDSIEVRDYDGVYEHPQFKLNWRANVTGTLNGLFIDPPSLIKSLVITKEKNIISPPEIREIYKEKSHLYAMMGLSWTDKAMNSVDAGIMYVRKEGWGLSASLGTDFNTLLYRGGLIIKLK